MLRFSVAAALAAALCVGGCDSTTEREVTEVASLCVNTDGDRLVVSGQMNACLSSSCDTLIESDCVLAETDGGLAVEARALIESRGGTCTADCGSVPFRCEFMPEADGDITVAAGSLSVDYAFPNGDEECVGDAF